nr:helix-turn-helix transcriptional regulator [Azospirillum sp. SYSU D00513]
MTREQSRAGRALLDWSQDDLARHAGTAARTVKDFERGARQPLDRTLRDLREALEAAGVDIIPAGQYEGGGGPGVRLKAEPADA